MGLDERVHHVLVLGAAKRAGGVDECSTGAGARGGLLEDLTLERREPIEGFHVEAVAQIRASAQRAQLRARGVDQHPVRLEARERAREPEVADAGALGAKEEAVEALGIRIVGEEDALVPHLGREQKRLAARAGAQIEHRLSGPGPEEQSQELAALVLDLEEAGLVRGRAEDVEACTRHEGGGGVRRQVGGHPILPEPIAKGFTVRAEEIRSQANGTWAVERVEEVVQLGAELGCEKARERIGNGVADRRVVGRLDGRRQRRGNAAQGLGFRFGQAHQISEEVGEQGAGSGLSECVMGEAATPETHAEEGFGRGGALGGGPRAVGAEEAIQLAVGRRAAQHGSQRDDDRLVNRSER